VETNEKEVLKSLCETLDEIGATLMEEVTPKSDYRFVTTYRRYLAKDQRTFLVTIAWEGRAWRSNVVGWDVYVPTAPTNSTPDTLAALHAWAAEPRRKLEEREFYLEHVLTLTLGAEPGAPLCGWRLGLRDNGALAWVHESSRFSIYATPGWDGDGLTVKVYSDDDEPIQTEHLDVEWTGNTPTDVATYRAAMEGFFAALSVPDEQIGTVEG
jgi:hypothetical protein